MAPDTQVNSGKRGGCLGGCLKIILVLALVLLALGVGGYLLARPYLVARAEQLKAEYPVLAILLNRDKGAVTGLAPNGAGAEPAPALARDRASLPADLFVYPDAAAESFALYADAAVVYSETSDAIDIVDAAVRKGMQALGWTTMSSADGLVRVTFWQKGDATCRIALETDEDMTLLWMRCDGIGSD